MAVAGTKKIYRDGVTRIYVLTTDTRPTLTLNDADTVCTMINATVSPVVVDSIWVWYGTGWAKY